LKQGDKPNKQSLNTVVTKLRERFDALFIPKLR